MGSGGGGGGHSVGQSSDSPDTKEGLEELCPVCGDKVREVSVCYGNGNAIQ